MLKMQSVITQTAVTQTSAFNGASVPTDRAYAISAQVTVVGTGATATAQFQKSNDGTNWVNDGSSVAIGTTGSYGLEKTQFAWRFMRIAYTVSAGTLNSVTAIIAQQQEIL